MSNLFDALPKFGRRIATVDNALYRLNCTVQALDDVQSLQAEESERLMDRAQFLRDKAAQHEIEADSARMEAQRAESIKRKLQDLLS